jgi:glycosyltransferase involved in cell wall biosynthesis
MKPLLNILICHIPERYDFLKRLNGILDPQLTPEVKVIIDDSRYKSIGRKRNDLMARADAEYVCFIDDDDRVSVDYVRLVMEGIKKDVDCCSLKGIITEDGLNPLIFEHSIMYKEYRTVGDEDNRHPGNVHYERYPNHLNVVKTEIAKWFKFPEEKHEFGDSNHGEDTSYATQMFRAGVLKSEHYIPSVIYYYDYRRKK